MASPDEAPTESERWRDLDMLLTRPGNLVEASFDPSPTVSRRRPALLLLCLSV
jgi:NEDD8-activating enzyme E1